MSDKKKKKEARELEPMAPPKATISAQMQRLNQNQELQLKTETVEWMGEKFIVHEADAERRFDFLRIMREFFDREVESEGAENVVDEESDEFIIEKNQFPLKAQLIALTVTDEKEVPLIPDVPQAEAQLRPYPGLVDALFPVVSTLNRLNPKESDIELEGN